MAVCHSFTFVFFLCLQVCSARDLSSEHPIEGVIKLLGELQDQAKEEGVTDTGNYNAYAKWCAESKEELDTAIKREKSEISRLEDKITGLKDEIEVLDNDIEYLGKQIEEQQNAATKAKKLRDDADALYEDEQDNLDETKDAVGVALESLEDSQTGLLQTRAGLHDFEKKIRKAAVLAEPRMSREQHDVVKEFMQQLKGGAALVQTGEAPIVPKEDYVDKSGAVIEKFGEMEDDFGVEKDESVESQTKDKNDYNRAKTSRDAAIEAAQDAKATKETDVADKRSKKAQAESDKQAENKALVADSTTLDNTVADCQDVKNQFEDRTKTRNDEIEAMEMAAKILEKVTGIRNPDTHEAPTRLLQKTQEVVQPKKALRGGFDYGKGEDMFMGFLQLDGKHHRHSEVLAKDAKGATNKVAAILIKAASAKNAPHTKALMQLANNLALYEGPFDKIIQMVEKMIFHLMSEQKEEDDMKNWCDLETEKSTEKKEDRTTKIREFTIKLESMDAMVQTLTGEIVEAQKKIVNINKYIKEETKLSEDNHQEAMLTIKDAKEGQAALKKATKILTAFYKESGMIAKEPWEFIQTGAKLNAPGDTVSLGGKPETWDSSYSGVSDPSNGDNAVLSLLEETSTKFADMEATTKANDETDQKNFVGDMNANKIELEETKTDEEMKTERKSSLEEKIEGMTEGKKHLAREKSAVVAYLKDLETPCSMGDDSYEDRKEARTSELEALREAQNVLVETQKGIVDKAEARAKNKKERTESGEN